jgi:hypothetical protein
MTKQLSKILIVLIGILLLAAGGAGAQTPVPSDCSTPPVIESFAANPPTIAPGQSSTLSWGLVSNAVAAGIDNGIGGVATPGQTTVTPAQTTTYTMEAVGCGGLVTTKSVTVVVSSTTAAPPAECVGYPVISSFTASPAVIQPGQTATLSWGLVSNAVAAGINNGIGGVGTPGQTTVTPAQTTTYTMYAVACNGLVTSRAVTVVVSPNAVATPATCVGAPVISGLAVNPPVIAPGQSSTLSWGLVSNAVAAGIDNGIGGVATPGQTTVKPPLTTTYTLYAVACNGIVSQQSVTLVVQ